MAPPRPPRVLVACDFLLKYAAGLAGGLANAGAETVLLTRDHGLEFGRDAAEMRSVVRQLAGPDVPQWRLPGRTRELRALRAVRAAADARAAFAPDVLHFQSAIENDVRLLWAAGMRDAPYAYTVHDPVKHPGDRPAMPHAAFLRHQLLHRAALVFVHAESLREELVERRRLRVPVEVVPHGVAQPRPQPLPDRPTILFFGRISQYKGLDVLLEAMPSVWSQVPEARLVVAGEGNVDDHPSLRDPRATLRREHVPEADVDALFADSTLVALPYVQASQSGVGSLAKSHARPVVVTRTGGLPELVADGSGVIVTPGDAAELATAMVEVLGDMERAQRMGAAAAASAANGSSWHAVATQTLAAYERHGLLRAVGERP
jgi:starch synthase